MRYDREKEGDQWVVRQARRYGEQEFVVWGDAKSTKVVTEALNRGYGMCVVTVVDHSGASRLYGPFLSFDEANKFAAKKRGETLVQPVCKPK